MGMKPEIKVLVESVVAVFEEAKRRKRKKRKTRKNPTSLLNYMDYAVSGDSVGDGGGA